MCKYNLVELNMKLLNNEQRKIIVNKSIYTCIKYRLKERVRVGPTQGPYKACMKFSYVQQILENGFGETSSYEAKKVLEEAFPGVVTTYVLGIRPSRIEAPTSAPFSSASVLPTCPTQESSHVTEVPCAFQADF